MNGADAMDAGTGRADAAGANTGGGEVAAARAHGATARRRALRFPTALLLTCAALGVAGGLLLAPANWISTALTAVSPFLGMAIAGLWLLPSVIALRLLRRPLVGLLVGLIAGLVIVPFSGYGIASVLTNLWWAAFTELPFLFVLWRYWAGWLHYVGAVLAGVVYTLSAWAWYDLGAMSIWGQAGFFIVSIASCVAGTALGILIADRLGRAGVGRRGVGRRG